MGFLGGSRGVWGILEGVQGVFLGGGNVSGGILRGLGLFRGVFGVLGGALGDFVVFWGGSEAPLRFFEGVEGFFLRGVGFFEGGCCFWEG